MTHVESPNAPRKSHHQLGSHAVGGLMIVHVAQAAYDPESVAESD